MNTFAALAVRAAPCALIVLTQLSPVSADVNFAGKTVTVFAGSSAGGTNDGYARLIARHIGKQLPGKPSVIMKNMPGAGSRKFATYLTSVASKDGLEFGLLSRDLLVSPVLYPERDRQFDARKFTWVGSPTRELLTCVSWHTSPVQSLADLKSKEFVIAATGGTDSGESVAANVLNALVGAKVRSIKGYPGGTEMDLAMQRGEVHGRCGLGWGAIRANYHQAMEAKHMKVLMQLAVKGHPDLKEVPALGDLVKSEDLSVLEVLFSNQAMGRPFAAPPNLPKEITAVLRASFLAALQDPDLLAEAKKTNYDISPVAGEEIEALADKLSKLSPEVLERARALSKS